ncbi:hypothetical protein Hanom_Chr10g00924181 [Helianthus anomalus]
MPFSSLRFGQFCDFHPIVCFSASGSKRLEILSFSSSSLTPSIFLRKVSDISVFLPTCFCFFFSKGILNTCTLC